LTPGEPAGIGPDLAVRLAQQRQPCDIIAIADPALLQARARLLNLPLTLEAVDYSATPAPAAAAAGTLRYDAVSCAARITPGTPNPASAGYVLATLDHAVALCRDRRCAALVTGPVHKGVIN